MKKTEVHSAAWQAVSQEVFHSIDTIHFHKNRYSGLCLFFHSSFLSFLHFGLLLSVFSVLPLSVSALMSQAHCAERSGSDVSLLLALNSQDGDWDDKASFFWCLLTSLVSTHTTFITLNIIILWRTGKRQQMKWEYYCMSKVRTT